MDAAATKPEVDRQKVHAILASLLLPKEIENVHAEFGSDSTGDPAVKLRFRVRDAVVIGPAELDRLTKFLSDVVRALLQADIGGFPYTRLEQAS
jgi:hypothetical protein